jgi:hypothetical protein
VQGAFGIEEHASNNAPNGQSLGIEFQGRQVALFGSHSGHAYARSVGVELNWECDHPGFAATPPEPSYDSIMVSVLAYDPSRTLHEVQLRVIKILGAVEFYVLDGWGKNKMLSASSLISTVMKNIRGFVDEHVQKEGWSIAVVISCNGQENHILKGGQLNFHHLVEGKLESPLEFSLPYYTANKLKGSVICSVGIKPLEIEELLTSFQTPVPEIAPALDQFEKLLKKGSAFFVIREVQGYERFGEIITPGLTMELEERFFSVDRNGVDSRRSFFARIRYADTPVRDFVIKLGLPDIGNYAPENPMPLEKQIEEIKGFQKRNSFLSIWAQMILDGTSEANHVEEQKVQKQSEVVVPEVIKNVQHEAVEVEIEVPQPPYVKLRDVAGPNPPKVSWPKDFKPTYKLEWLPADPDYIVIEGIGRVTREQVYYARFDRRQFLFTLRDGRVVPCKYIPEAWNNVAD